MECEILDIPLLLHRFFFFRINISDWLEINCSTNLCLFFFNFLWRRPSTTLTVMRDKSQKEHAQSRFFKFFNVCYKYKALRHHGLHNTDQCHTILRNKHWLKYFQKPRGQSFFLVTYSHSYSQKPNFSVFGQQKYTDITTIPN